MTTSYTKQFPNNISAYPQDIAETFVKLIEQYESIEGKENLIKELENALYNLRCCAENEHNFDYFRVLYNTLAKISELTDIYVNEEV